MGIFDFLKQPDIHRGIADYHSTPGAVLLDVRTPQEYREGHIPGAINIPNEDIGSDEISVLTDPEALILVYCRSGNRSKQSAEKLAALGYTNVAEFGGILDWPGETVSGND